MAVRVTATEVKQILDTTLEDTIVDVFIISANKLTDRVQAYDADNDSVLDTDTLKEIERWLGAHFTAIRDVRVSSEKAGDVAQNFQYKVDLNLAQTQYGQQAILLDASGYLGKIQDESKNGGKKRAKLSVLGTPEDEYPTDDAPSS